MQGHAREDLLHDGEEAVAVADWERARGCFERVLEHEESPEALTGLSKVAMIDREYERAIELKERAFKLYVRDGQYAPASALAGRSAQRACSKALRSVRPTAG